MLYEVITAHVQVVPGQRSVRVARGEAGHGVEPHVGEGLIEGLEVEPFVPGGQHLAAFHQGLHERRITSYNVCYTKLLRTVWFRLWNQDDPALWEEHPWTPWGAIVKCMEMRNNFV